MTSHNTPISSCIDVLCCKPGTDIIFQSCAGAPLCICYLLDVQTGSFLAVFSSN